MFFEKSLNTYKILSAWLKKKKKSKNICCHPLGKHLFYVVFSVL